MQNLAPVIPVPRHFWDEAFGDTSLPKEVKITFEVAGQPADVSTQGFISAASEDAELRLSGLWAVFHDHFPGYRVVEWCKESTDTIKLRLQSPDTGDDEPAGLDRKRRAPPDLPEPQAKLQAVGSQPAVESPSDQGPQEVAADWKPEVRDGVKPAVETTQRLVATTMLQPSRGRRGGAGGRARGGSRANSTGRGCAKLVRTTTRLYIGVGQVREWLGEVGARTELQVKVMLDNRMLYGVHQADLLYNKGAHYYWITSRTLKRTAMGKWFLGWNHNSSDGLVLLLRSPSKDEIAAAIAEGFQAKEEEEETELSEQLQLQQQVMQAQQQRQQQQQPMVQAPLPLSPPSPRQGRVQPTRSLAAFASSQYMDEEPTQQHPLAPETEDIGDGGQYQRPTPLAMAPRLRLGGEDDDAIHRSRQGHCFLYNLPPSVLDGRCQQDWMISEDGCLVLCMTSLPQAPTLVENISVRSNPSNPKAGLLGVAEELGTGSIRNQPSAEEPSFGRSQRNALGSDLAAPGQLHRPMGRAAEEQELFLGRAGPKVLDAEAGMVGAAEPLCMEAALPVAEPKSELGRIRSAPMVVPRQAIESLYGVVELPLPVLLRYQVDGELEPKVYLAEVTEANGELVLRGTPAEAMLGRTLVGWRRANVMSHQLLVVCLETRSDGGLPQAKAAQALVRTDPGVRGEQQTVMQRNGVFSSQQPQQSLQWATSSELQGPTRLRNNTSSMANPYGQQVSYSGAPVSTLPTPRPSLQLQTSTGPLSSQQQRLPPSDSGALTAMPQMLQSIPSGLLPGVGSSKLPSSNSLLNTPSTLPPAPSGDGGAGGARWRANGDARPLGGGGGTRGQPSQLLDDPDAIPQRVPPPPQGYQWVSVAEAGTITQGTGGAGPSAFALDYGMEPLAPPDGRRQGGATHGMAGVAGGGSHGQMVLERIPSNAGGHVNASQYSQQSLQQLHYGRRDSDVQGSRKSSGSWGPGHDTGPDPDAAAAERGRRPLPAAGGAGRDREVYIVPHGTEAAFTLRFGPGPGGGGAQGATVGNGGRVLELAGPSGRDAQQLQQQQRSRPQSEAFQHADARMQEATGDWRPMKLEQQQRYEEEPPPPFEPSLRDHLAGGAATRDRSTGFGRNAQWDASERQDMGTGQDNMLPRPSPLERERGQGENVWQQHPAGSPAERMDMAVEDEQGNAHPAADSQRPLRAYGGEAAGAGADGVLQPNGYPAQRLPMLPPQQPSRFDARVRDQAADGDGMGMENLGGRDAGEHREVAEQQGRQTQSWSWRREEPSHLEAPRRDESGLRRESDASGPPQQYEGPGGGALAARPGLMAAPATRGEPQWLPRLDLSGSVAPEYERRESGPAVASRIEQEGAGRYEDTAPDLGEQPPPRRPAVLRLLSAVQREPEEPQM